MAIKDHKSLQDSKILLVEDDKSIRLTVSETLNSEGFRAVSYTHLTLPTTLVV